MHRLPAVHLQVGILGLHAQGVAELHGQRPEGGEGLLVGGTQVHAQHLHHAVGHQPEARPGRLRALPGDALKGPHEAPHRVLRQVRLAVSQRPHEQGGLHPDGTVAFRVPDAVSEELQGHLEELLGKAGQGGQEVHGGAHPPQGKRQGGAVGDPR